MIGVKSYTIRKAVERRPSPFQDSFCEFRQVAPAYQVRDTRVIHVAISSVWSETGKEAEVKIYRTPVARLYFGFQQAVGVLVRIFHLDLAPVEIIVSLLI